MSIITQGYGAVGGFTSPPPPISSGLETARGRVSALVEPWAVIIPDGEIDLADREALLGQYDLTGDFIPSDLILAYTSGKVVLNT